MLMLLFLKISKEEAIEIENTTKEQAGNDRWRKERKKRLTASKVILKMSKQSKSIIRFVGITLPDMEWRWSTDTAHQ